MGSSSRWLISRGWVISYPSISRIGMEWQDQDGRTKIKSFWIGALKHCNIRIYMVLKNPCSLQNPIFLSLFVIVIYAPCLFLSQFLHHKEKHTYPRRWNQTKICLNETVSKIYLEWTENPCERVWRFGLWKNMGDKHEGFSFSNSTRRFRFRTWTLLSSFWCRSEEWLLPFSTPNEVYFRESKLSHLLFLVEGPQRVEQGDKPRVVWTSMKKRLPKPAEVKHTTSF